MDSPGHKFLSRAGFALDEDRGVCSGYLLGLRQHFFHCKALPHDLSMISQQFDFLMKIDVLILESLFELLDLPEAFFELQPDLFAL